MSQLHDFLSNVPIDFDSQSQDNKKIILNTIGDYIKLEIAHIIILIDDYEDYQDNLEDLHDDIEEANKKERKEIKTKIQFLKNNIMLLKRKICMKWNKFDELKLNSNENIMLVGNGDTYYMTNVIRIQRSINKWTDK